MKAILTTEEKILLMGGYRRANDSRDGGLHGIDRAGIPLLKCADGPLGVHWWTDASTAYPALMALAASFDPELAFRAGEAIGKDCRAAGVHILLSPGVNLYRSPLCGRNFEYMGEDPELAGKMSAAYIRGVQSCKVAATIKHFAANNQEFNRHWTSSDVDERTLREVYLRPFELAVKEGGTGLVMTAYNLLNGQHCSENKWLLQTVLREEWGFEGLVISDWTSVYSTAQTLHAGLDLEMPVAVFLTPEKIKPMLDNGVVTQATLDRSVLRRIALMERFGWLDPEHVQKDASLSCRSRESEETALEMERGGIVLLRNEDSFLPVEPGRVKKITLLGHHADHPVIAGGGSAYCAPTGVTTLRQAMEQIYGESVGIECYEMVDPWRGAQAWANSGFRTPDGKPGLHAEYFNNNRLKGAPACVRTDERINFRAIKPFSELKDGVFYSVRWTGRFETEREEEVVFYMLSFGGELNLRLDGEWIEKADRGGPLWRTLPAGRHDIEMTWRQIKGGNGGCSFGFEPASRAITDYEKGLAAARDSDLVVVAAGFVEHTERENYDRPFALDRRIDRLIQDAAEANPSTVVALYSGGAVDPSAWIGRVKAVLCLWYPGQNGTIAAAEILAGKTCPSGKLPFTWEYRPEDRGSFDCYHDTDEDGRTAYLDGVFTGYRHFDRQGIAPRFPFGYGLSYTQFKMENLKADSQIDPVRGACAQVEVVNAGSCSGAATVLFFVSDEEASRPRPPRELKEFCKVFLAPGERKTVSVTLPPRAFSFWDMDAGKWRAEAGRFSVLAGPDAGSLPLQAELNLAEGWTIDP